MKRIGVLAATIATAVSSFSSFEAEACTALLPPAPVCSPGEFLPRPWRAVPQNAPELLLTYPWRTYPWSATVEMHDGPISLVDAAGAGVTFSTERSEGSPFLVVRPAGLQVGTHRLRFEERCVDDDWTAAVEREVVLEVTPSAEVPSVASKLTARVQQEDDFRIHGGASCFQDIPAAVASFEVTPDATLIPWHSLLRWRVEIHGKKGMKVTAWGTSPDGYGGPIVVGGVHAACAEANLQPGDDQGLAEGTYTVTVTPELFGHGPLPASSTEMELRCEEPRRAGGCGAAGGGASSSLAVAALGWGLSRRQRRRTL